MIRRIVLILIATTLTFGSVIGCHGHNTPYLLPNHRL
jgi:hypothetical protein